MTMSKDDFDQMFSALASLPRRARVCRNTHAKRAQQRYAEMLSRMVIRVPERTRDPETGKLLPLTEDAQMVTIDLRCAMVSYVHDGLKVGMVLQKKSTALNGAVCSDICVYCNDRLVLSFERGSPPKKYQRNGWMMLRHAEKIAARNQSARWTISVSNPWKGYRAQWERKRPGFWVLTRIDDADDFPVLDGVYNA